MANVDTPFGLRPVGDMHGKPWTGAPRAYSVAAAYGTALMLGDPVKIVGTSQTINGVVYADIERAATGDVLTGTVVSVDPTIGSGASGRDSTIYRAASTQRIVYVCDDPNALFEIQEVSGGTALAAADIGLNADFVVAAGSTTTGMSGVELDNATEATTNTLDLKIVGLVNREGNEVGEHAKWLVRINRHRYANQIAGV